MCVQCSDSLLDETLRTVARRYRLPPFDAQWDSPQHSAAVALALVIERARRAQEAGSVPNAALEGIFTEALARLIYDAMREEGGDPAFQAVVLRHQVSQVREYASLSAHADRDRRLVRANVDRIAHPAKQRRTDSQALCGAMARLHALARSSAWEALQAASHELLDASGAHLTPWFQDGLKALADHPALKRLGRLQYLSQDEQVQRYQALWDRQGPRSGSMAALEQGAVSQRRGAASEASAARAFETLAALLDASSETARYRVVTSMRVPSSMPGDAERSKTEWDVVLLRQSESEASQWDLCLLGEAKASVDAAAGDLPRLLRGLRLLANADADTVYAFRSRQGEVLVRGASLAALCVDEHGLAGSVLYCCDAPADTDPRLLGASARMQLLSARASLDVAASMANGEKQGGQGALSGLWRALLSTREWKGVRQQYAVMRQARALMVHTDDLLLAIARVFKA